MAFTVVQDAYSIFGNMRVGVYSLTFDNSYSTGGDALSASELGLSEILYADVQAKNEAAGKMLYRFDYTSGALKIEAFYPTGGTAPATLVAPAYTVTSGASTASAVDSTTPAVTEVGGIGVQVAAATDLSSLQLKLLVIGK